MYDFVGIFIRYFATECVYWFKHSDFLSYPVLEDPNVDMVKE